MAGAQPVEPGFGSKVSFQGTQGVAPAPFTARRGRGLAFALYNRRPIGLCSTSPLPLWWRQHLCPCMLMLSAIAVYFRAHHGHTRGVSRNTFSYWCVACPFIEAKKDKETSSVCARGTRWYTSAR